MIEASREVPFATKEIESSVVGTTHKLALIRPVAAGGSRLR